MQFNITSDYAIRTVLYLAKHYGRPCSATEVEKGTGVPSVYLYKVTRKLRNAKILKTVQGAQGGYILLKDPKEITLYDILYLTEPTMKINCCIENGKCSGNRIEACKVRRVFCHITKKIENEFKKIKIDSLIDDEDS